MGVEQLGEIVREFLDLARIEAGQLRLVCEPVHLPRVVDASLTRVDGQARERGIRVTADVDRDIPPVWGDALRLRVVLDNILSNALKYTPSDGSIARGVPIARRHERGAWRLDPGHRHRSWRSRCVPHPHLRQVLSHRASPGRSAFGGARRRNRALHVPADHRAARRNDCVCAWTRRTRHVHQHHTARATRRLRLNRSTHGTRRYRHSTAPSRGLIHGVTGYGAARSGRVARRPVATAGHVAERPLGSRGDAAAGHVGPERAANRAFSRRSSASCLRSAANPLVIILLIAGIASAVLGETTEAAIIGAIVLMSAGINVWQTFRSQRAVARLAGADHSDRDGAARRRERRAAAARRRRRRCRTAGGRRSRAGGRAARHVERSARAAGRAHWRVDARGEGGVSRRLVVARAGRARSGIPRHVDRERNRHRRGVRDRP